MITPRGKPGFGVTPRGLKALVVADDESDNDEYDDEQDLYGEEQEIEDELFNDLYSQQNYEVYGILMDPLKREMDDFLNKDDVYNWNYTNPIIIAAS